MRRLLIAKLSMTENKILYRIHRKRIKNLILAFDKHGGLVVCAPHWVSLCDIDTFVQSKKSWIDSHKHKNQELRCVHGARIPYFDTSYTLKLIPSTRNKIAINGDVLELFSTDLNNEKRNKKILLSWYKEHSRDEVARIIESHKNAINREVARFTIRDMSTRWGSCNHKTASITLNVRLFGKPKLCFEYVLAHELAHLVYPNHSHDFYAFLDFLFPRWQEARNMLR